MAAYTYNLYNKMDQKIKHKGQLSIGDRVTLRSRNVLNITYIEENTGKAGTQNYVYLIKFIKGKGWLLNPASV